MICYSTGKVRSMRTPPLVFFVLPCFNEYDQLPITASALDKKVRSLFGQNLIDGRSRVLFVDDGSTDGTWARIEYLHRRNVELFHGIKLAHNRGHQNALLLKA